MTNTLVNLSGTSDKQLMRAWATHLAGYIFTHGAGVKGLELFGSIARGNVTVNSDFDIIICTSTPTALRWAIDVMEFADGHYVYDESVASFRRRTALGVIGISPVDLEAATGIQTWKQDFFLFPPDWRDWLDVLQQLGHHRDPNFMRNIAHDALTFVPNQGFAFAVHSWNDGNVDVDMFNCWHCQDIGCPHCRS